MEDQHRSRVHVKNLAHTGKQLDEQVIDIKPCERAVSQRLEVRQTLCDSTVIINVRRLGRRHAVRMPDLERGKRAVATS